MLLLAFDFIKKKKQKKQQQHYLRTDAKVRVYKTVVHPILTYIAETRPDTAKISQLLEMTEMKTLRRIMNVTRLNRMKSEDIREKCGIQKVGEWIKRRTEWLVCACVKITRRPTGKESDDKQAGRNKK